MNHRPPNSLYLKEYNIAPDFFLLIFPFENDLVPKPRANGEWPLLFAGPGPQKYLNSKVSPKNKNK